VRGRAEAKVVEVAAVAAIAAVAVVAAIAAVAEVEVGLKLRAWRRCSSCRRWGSALSCGVEQFSVIKLVTVVIAVVYLVNSGEGEERR
jgi:hypothetical protein